MVKQGCSVKGLLIGVCLLGGMTHAAQAQLLPLPAPDPRSPSSQPQPLPTQPLPDLNEDVLPPPADLLPPAPDRPAETTPLPTQIIVKRFNVEGSTVFSAAEFDRLFTDQGFIGQPLSFVKLQAAADAVTQLYTSKGYITSGAYIPANQRTGAFVLPDRSQEAEITIQVVEGGLEAIQITGLRRLKPNYIRSRLALATQKPLNYERLFEALQLLRLDRSIQDISADLATGATPGQSVLKVNVTEARSFRAQLATDNFRSPSVGTNRRIVQVSQANLLGLGDDLTLSYINTTGSHEGTLSYVVPINPRNGTITVNVGLSKSHVIEDPFDFLDIESESRYVELSYRQPIVLKPTREIAIGVTVGRQFNRATLIDDEIPFPTRGSDFAGYTRVSTVRFFQEATWRSRVEVIGLRSQFSFGLNLLDATMNDRPPDGQFFSWRGQAQWARLLAPETLLLLRGDIQLADRPVVPVEQFGIGGALNVRGYRQDALIGDNGVFASAEVRLPIARFPKQAALLQAATFVDVGSIWNRSGGEPDPNPRTLVSVGLGLRLQAGDRLSAQFDWGIPLTDFPGRKRTWQENGLYFSLVYSLF